jgi:hypothetical protein
MVNVPFIKLKLGWPAIFTMRAAAPQRCPKARSRSPADPSSSLGGARPLPCVNCAARTLPSNSDGTGRDDSFEPAGSGGTNRNEQIDIWRAIRAGALSAKKTDDGGFAIDPDDLFAVFETKQANQCRRAKDAASSLEVSESPETTTISEAVETELKGLPVLPAEAPTSYELRQDRDERPAVDLAELNAQLAEPAAERAKVEKMVQYAALPGEHDKPWWRRLVGWIWTRRGRAARKRLRERL